MNTEPIKFIQKLLRVLRKKHYHKVGYFSAYGSLFTTSEYDLKIHNVLEANEKYSVDFPKALISELVEALKKFGFGHGLGGSVMEMVIKLNANPLPREMGLSFLASRQTHLVKVLSNSKQDIEVYFAAAELDTHARSRLCIRLFVEPEYQNSDLARFLKIYGHQRAVRILQGKKPAVAARYMLFTESEQAILKDTSDFNANDPERYKKDRKNFKRGSYIGERNAEDARLWKQKTEKKDGLEE